MSIDQSPTPTRTEPAEAEERLSLTKVTASVLATITATVALSFLGVAGTVAGAAVASVVTVIGNHLYTRSIQLTSESLLSKRPSPSPSPKEARPGGDSRSRTLHLSSPKNLLYRVTAVFVMILSAVTVVEVVVHKPLADVVRGQPGQGTTLLGQQTDKPSAPTSPTVRKTVNPSTTSTGPTAPDPAGSAATPTTSHPPAPSSSSTATGPSGSPLPNSRSSASTAPIPSTTVTSTAATPTPTHTATTTAPKVTPSTGPTTARTAAGTTP